MVMGYNPEEQQRIVHNLNYRLASLLVNYPGMSLRDSRLIIKDLDPLVGRVKSNGEPEGNMP
jgi:hypothetical protein